MTPKEINEALMQRLLSCPDRPQRGGILRMDDKASDSQETPRWEVTVAHTKPRVQTLDRVHEQTGELRVSVVDRAGTFARYGNQHGAAIAAHFDPATCQIPGIEITAMAHQPGGYKDGDLYRTPVLIPFRVVT